MSNIFTSNIEVFGIYTVTANIGSVAANTSEAETFTLTGAKIGDFVAVSKPSVEAGIMFGSARVSAANTIEVTVMNTTAGAIDEASETLIVFLARPTSTRASVEE